MLCINGRYLIHHSQHCPSHSLPGIVSNVHTIIIIKRSHSPAPPSVTTYSFLLLPVPSVFIQ